MKTLKKFSSKSNLPEALVRAVVRQTGGWDSFKEMAEDVANHGADAGWRGFTYYTDTVKFYHNNRSEVNSMASEQAEVYGLDGAASMVTGFNCLNGDYSVDEVAETLYGPKADMDTQVANAMAWYALEEVSRSYVDLTEYA